MAQLPPQNHEAEQSLLGAALLASRGAVVDALSPRLKPRHFYSRRHGEIWAAMVRLRERGEPVDSVVVLEEIRRGGKVEQSAFVHSLLHQVADAGNWRSYGRIVLECAALRGKLQAARRVVEAIYAADFAALADAERALLRIQVPIDVPAEPAGRPRLRRIA